MSKFSSAPAVPPPPPLPPAPPDKSDAEIQAKAAEERKRLQLASGRGSTILSGGTGVTDEANVGTKTLLG